MPGQSYVRDRLIEGATREIELLESGLTVRVRRARPYRMIGARAVPIGTLVQNLAKITWHAARGEDITDEEACAINEDAPSSAELCEALLIECVEAMREGDREWEIVNVVEDSVGDEDLGRDDYRVGDFQRSLPHDDLALLMHEVFEHNGLGEVIAKLIAPFRAKPGPPPPHAREDIRGLAH